MTVLDDLEVKAYDLNKNVDLIIQGSVNFNVLGSSLFERVTGNDRNKRLRLHLLGSATMAVANNFTFNYNICYKGEDHYYSTYNSDYNSRFFIF